MKYNVILSPAAQRHLNEINLYQQGIAKSAIKKQLYFQPLVETTNRKPLSAPVDAEPWQYGHWELKDGIIRVFYVVDHVTVYITAVGVKERNKLYVDGKYVNSFFEWYEDNK